jgi:general secretion pathway protein E
MNEEIHSMIVERQTAHEIRMVAQRHGMRTMQECGWELVKNGTTTLDEIMLYANLQEEK